MTTDLTAFKSMITPEDALHIIDQQSEDLIFVLRAHLLVEHFLDHIIHQTIYTKLNGHESFYTKTLVIDALCLIPTELLYSIQELNTLRNKFAHKIGYSMSKNDAIKITDSINRYYLKTERTKKRLELKDSLLFLIGFLMWHYKKS